MLILVALFRSLLFLLSKDVSSDVTPPAGLITPNVCGQSDYSFSATIVGGQEAHPHEFPWQALVITDLDGDRRICGGTLLNSNWLVTAGHCLHKVRLPDISIGLGLHKLTDVEQYPLLKPSRSIIHEDYNPDNTTNDIALIKINDEITLNSTVNVACLPQTGQEFQGKAVVSGWGKTKESGQVSRNLQKVEVSIFEDQYCEDILQKKWSSYGYMCAGIETGGKDSCSGDSGGPLVKFVDNSAYLIGIVSWGEGCARPNNPGVYTKVTDYMDWIVYHVSEN